MARRPPRARSPSCGSAMHAGSMVSNQASIDLVVTSPPLPRNLRIYLEHHAARLRWLSSTPERFAASSSALAATSRGLITAPRSRASRPSSAARLSSMSRALAPPAGSSSSSPIRSSEATRARRPSRSGRSLHESSSKSPPSARSYAPISTGRARVPLTGPASRARYRVPAHRVPLRSRAYAHPLLRRQFLREDLRRGRPRGAVGRRFRRRERGPRPFSCRSATCGTCCVEIVQKGPTFGALAEPEEEDLLAILR